MKNRKTYPGAKCGHGSFQHIISEIPPLRQYIELFGGSGQVCRRIPVHVERIIYEIDEITIQEHLHDLAGVTIIRSCGIEALKDIIARPCTDKFIYADPPYLLTTRRKGGKLYRYEWTEAQHLEFLSVAIEVRARVAISHYECSLYNEMLKGWRKKSWQVRTRKGNAIETLYMNYDEPAELLTYEYLGTNSIDRQRIKRKIERYVATLMALPVQERNAIVRAIQSQVLRS